MNSFFCDLGTLFAEFFLLLLPSTSTRILQSNVRIFRRVIIPFVLSRKPAFASLALRSIRYLGASALHRAIGAAINFLCLFRQLNRRLIFFVYIHHVWIYPNAQPFIATVPIWSSVLSVLGKRCASSNRAVILALIPVKTPINIEYPYSYIFLCLTNFSGVSFLPQNLMPNLFLLPSSDAALIQRFVITESRTRSVTQYYSPSDSRTSNS